MHDFVMNNDIKARLSALARTLVNQDEARVLVPPQKNQTGFWFGGGNIVTLDGAYYIVGRYRNFGDSRTGLGQGERGLELAIFRAETFDGTGEKVKSFSKSDLDLEGRRVLSIEGASLVDMGDRVELYVSTEKEADYPDRVANYQKPGTGVWSVDVMSAPSVDKLSADSLRGALASVTPATLHVKDPVAYPSGEGDVTMIYCTHPFSWTSSNTGVAVRRQDDDAFRVLTDCLVPRGFVWDVAMTRVTERMPVPKLGLLKDMPQLALYFYDGGECVRQLDENPKAVKRPRGYSCEEIGGAAAGPDGSFGAVERLSVNQPFFVSPRGTGCSRYTSVLVDRDAVHVAWQQSQDDLSQPLVGYSLPMDDVEKILS